MKIGKFFREIRFLLEEVVHVLLFFPISVIIGLLTSYYWRNHRE